MLHNMSVSETTVHDIIFGNDTLSTEENKLNIDVIFQFVRDVIFQFAVCCSLNLR